MKENIKRFAVLGSTMLGTQIAGLALAATTFNGTLPPAPVTNISGFVNLICTVAGWLFVFLIVLSVIFIILAAFNYLTASGDPEKVKSASNQLIYAVVAIAVAVIARGVPLIVTTFVGVSSGVQTC